MGLKAVRKWAQGLRPVLWAGTGAASRHFPRLIRAQALVAQRLHLLARLVRRVRQRWPSVPAFIRAAHRLGWCSFKWAFA